MKAVVKKSTYEHTIGSSPSNLLIMSKTGELLREYKV